MKIFALSSVLIKGEEGNPPSFPEISRGKVGLIPLTNLIFILQPYFNTEKCHYSSLQFHAVLSDQYSQLTFQYLLKCL